MADEHVWMRDVWADESPPDLPSQARVVRKGKFITDEALAERDARMVAAGRRQAAGLVDYVRIQHHTLGLHDHMGANLSCHGCGLLSAAEAAPAEPVEEADR